MEAIAKAPGKVILTGEHACVYGEPAIVLAIDRYAKATASLRDDDAIYIASSELGVSGFFRDDKFEPKVGGNEAKRELEPIYVAVRNVLTLTGKKIGVNLEIKSEIPVAVGLGSSAAVVVAAVAATSKLLGSDLPKEKIRLIAHDAEKLVHKTPSGIDDNISTYGGTLIFQKDTGVSYLKVPYEITLVIGNTSIKRSTGMLVEKVRKFKQRYPDIANSIISSIGMVTRAAIEMLKRKNLEELGFLFNLNHELLSALGVSNEALDKLVYGARKAGAFGAKLTGAGGGGCMIALVSKDRARSVMTAIEEAGGVPFTVRKDDEGVRAWLVR